MPTDSTDRIEKKVLLRAPRSRIWRAISDSKEFGSWFGVAFHEPFAAGRKMDGQITIKGYEHVPMTIVVERVEPEHLFTYRWHPYAIDPSTDYSKEPMTLVELRLAEVEGGTELTIIESGFDKLPPERRTVSLRMNDAGWSEQAKNIANHVAK